MQTGIDIIDRDTTYISSDDRKWINKINSLKEQYPDDVEIITPPEKNDGCIYCRITGKISVKLAVQRRVELTDDQRKQMAERLKNARNYKQNQTTGDDDMDEQ